MSSQYLKTKEVCSLLGISRQTLFQWCKQNRFPKPLKVNGGALRWRAQDIRIWLKTRILGVEGEKNI